MSESAAHDALADLPESLRASLSEEQRRGLDEALNSRPWRRHAVNLRVSIPVPGGPFYVTLVADRERRDPGRRAQERTRHPWRTAGNLVFVLGVLVLVYGLAILGTLTFAAIIEF